MENVQNAPTPSKLFAKGDILLIAIILITALGITLHLFSSKDNPTVAELYINNKLVKTMPLTQEGYYKFKYDNVSFSIEAKEGRVRISESNCPRKVCVHQGWISHSGESIICVPNKVVVKIKGEEKMEKGKVDAITF